MSNEEYKWPCSLVVQQSFLLGVSKLCIIFMALSLSSLRVIYILFAILQYAFNIIRLVNNRRNAFLADKNYLSTKSVIREKSH